MAWRGPRTGNDPLLKTHHWRTVVRPYWQAVRLPCARCGRAIDYDGPSFYDVPGFTRGICPPDCLKIGPHQHRNPASLDVGHIVSRARAKRLGWAADQISDLANTQPEHFRCNSRSGQRDGQRVQAARRQVSAAMNAGRW